MINNLLGATPRATERKILTQITLIMKKIHLQTCNGHHHHHHNKNVIIDKLLPALMLTGGTPHQLFNCFFLENFTKTTYKK